MSFGTPFGSHENRCTFHFRNAGFVNFATRGACASIYLRALPGMTVPWHIARHCSWRPRADLYIAQRFALLGAMPAKHELSLSIGHGALVYSAILCGIEAAGRLLVSAPGRSSLQHVLIGSEGPRSRDHRPLPSAMTIDRMPASALRLRS